MGTFKDIIRLIVITVVVIIVVIFGMSMVNMKPSLLPHERQLVQFNYEKVGIIERTPVVVTGVSSPFSGTEDTQKDFPPADLSKLAPPGEEKGESQRVSMVLIKDRTKIAIVDGMVVREGDKLKNGQIKKIDKNGILLRDNEGERWLTIR
ncbi:MAG: hypothetical protein A4E64_00333 [Syntrophorhabdus sp. PtaU1.Bin058]|nr:MAG: hypothetical protein A4E64_00333 [Syntrophorhabdus sp. PtaU1.Bin058]